MNVSLCDIATWLPNCHQLVIIKGPRLLSQQRGVGRAFCVSSNDSGSPCEGRAKTGTAAYASGSTGPLCQPVLAGATPAPHCLLLATQTVLSICDELGEEFQERSPRHQAGGKASPPLPATCPPAGLLSSFTGPPAHWDVPRTAGSARGSTLVDADGVGCT